MKKAFFFQIGIPTTFIIWQFLVYSASKAKKILTMAWKRPRESMVKRLSRAIMGKANVDDEVLDNLEEALIIF